MDDFGTTQYYKRCTACLCWKVERDAFRLERRRRTGLVPFYAAECKACLYARRRERYRKRRESGDPGFADLLEAQRIRKRLRRIDAGLPVRDRRRDSGEEDGSRGAVLPPRPLATAVMREVARRRTVGLWALDDRDGAGGVSVDDVCDQLGFDARTIRRWLSGEGGAASMEVADLILTRLGLNPWDVWDEQTTRKPMFVAIRRGVYSAGGSQKRAMRTKATVPYGDGGPDEHGLALVRWKFDGEPRPADPAGYPYKRKAGGGYRFTGDACDCGAPWQGP